MRQLSRRQSGGEGLLLLLLELFGLFEEVELVVSSSSTQAMMRKGNWKNEEMHMLLCELVGPRGGAIRWCRRRRI